MSATLTTGDALLRAIRDDPADDLVRLAYADWLEETGEVERAEFIRVQIEWAVLDAGGHTTDPFHGHFRKDCPVQFTADGCEGCSRMIFCRARETQLRSAFYEIGTYAEFRRGFVHTVRCPLAIWLEHGPAVVRLHPVERVEATDRDALSGAWWNTWLHFQDPHGWELGDLLDGAASWRLPGPVWEALAGAVAVGETWKTYEGRQAAHDALSVALLLLAEGRA